MTTLVSQSAFAAHMHVNRSTVTRWKADGRLVFIDGQVDVEASQQRLTDTEGPRDDVAARHAAAKGQPLAPRGESRALAQSRKEAAQADIAEIERDKLRGKLIERADVTAATADVVIGFRQALENLPHLAAPLLVGKDQDAIRATLKDEIHDRLRAMERNLAEQLQALGEVAA